MTVRSIFIRYRNVKYQIDGILYESEMYIPEIVRDKPIRTYGKLGDTVFIKTRERFKTVDECNEELRNTYGKYISVEVKSYVEDDGSIWYYYTSAKYGDSDAYETIEEAYENANDYLNGVGELW